MPTTTTMAVSSPLNPTSTSVATTQVMLKDDDAVALLSPPQLQSNLDALALDAAAQLSSPIPPPSASAASTTTATLNGDDNGDIIKANGNNNVKNGAISNLLTGEHGSPKIALPISAIGGSTASSAVVAAAAAAAAALCPTDIDTVDLNIKTTDMSCLNIVTSSASPTSVAVGASAAAPNIVGGGGGSNHFLNGSNGHLLMAQSNSLNFQAASSPTDSPWSIGDETSSAGGFANFPSPNSSSGGGNSNNGHMHKRSILSQQQQLHHALSPNSLACNSSASQQQQQQQQQQQFIQHYNKNNGSNSGNNFSAWSNHSGPNSPWQQQQQQQQQQMQLMQSSSSSSGWNRGRSAPNLNPLSSHVMQQQSHQRKHQNPNQFSMPSSASNLHQQQAQQPHQGLSPNLTSPSKYRRSTSYPGKNQMHAFPMDVGSMIEDQPYMSYQDRNSMDMRSLEHCLNDITNNTAGVQSDLKGFLNSTTTLQSLAQLQGKLDSFHEFIPGKPFYQCDDATEETGNSFLDGNNLQIGSPARSSPHSQGSDNGERFSRKVFVGGLPPDIDEDEITASFRRYGPLVVDWPHKAESKSYFPPKGYAFLLFQDESSVQTLIEHCIVEEDKLYICVSSPTIKNKPVQIRPWRLSDADFVLNGSMPLDPRKTVFVGGVPRPLKALELAMIMDRLYGGVCYAGIDTDPELKYPKGAGRVAFSNQQSYIAAISARFVQLQHNDIDKRVEVKPYVLDDQMCDECQGQRCSGKFAPFFCANVTCLQYYCEHCWATIHSRPGREYHKPLVKEGADRPRAVPFRWC